jgi:hypothetical protein
VTFSSLTVAYKRFSDTIPLTIDHRYVRAFEKTIQATLVSGLKISASDAHDRCAKWMAEPQSVVRRRAELTDRKERLEAARMELMEVPGVAAMREKLLKMNRPSHRARSGTATSTTRVVHAPTSIGDTSSEQRMHSKSMSLPQEQPVPESLMEVAEEVGSLASRSSSPPRIVSESASYNPRVSSRVKRMH